jgi:Flp pilus assembly protein TadD
MGNLEFGSEARERLTSATRRFEIEMLEHLLAQAPDDLELLAELGALYTRAGLFEKGLEVDRRLVELAPENPVSHYNLACSYALLGRLDLAFASLDLAVARGYRDLAHLDRDPDLDPLRSDPRFALLRAKVAAEQEEE